MRRARPARPRSPAARGGEAAVTDVLGAILMVGITVVMAVGIGLLLLSFDGPPDTQHTRLAVTLGAGDGVWGNGDEEVRVAHLGGEALDADDTTLLVTSPSGTTTLSGAALASAFADGGLTIGEEWVLTVTAQQADTYEVRVVVVTNDATQLLAEATLSPTAAGGTTTTVYTYVGSATPTLGTVSALAEAQSAADTTPALLEEGATTGTPGTAGPAKFSGTAAATGGALDRNNTLASDDARATLDTTGDSIEVSGFDLPSNAATVTAVTIGYEGRKSANGGTSPTTRLDYKVGTGAYSDGTSVTESATSDTDRTRALSGTFSVADVEAMTVRVYAVSVATTGSARTALVDHVFATVTYTTTAGTVYRMDVILDFAGVPTSGAHTLDLVHQTADDTYTLQVWDNTGSGSWSSTACAGALSSPTSLSTYTCSLSSSHVSGAGAVRVRVLDVLTSGTTAGKLFLDHARVVTVS